MLVLLVQLTVVICNAEEHATVCMLMTQILPIHCRAIVP